MALKDKQLNPSEKNLNSNTKHGLDFDTSAVEDISMRVTRLLMRQYHASQLK